MNDVTDITALPELICSAFVNIQLDNLIGVNKLQFEFINKTVPIQKIHFKTQINKGGDRKITWYFNFPQK